jgi:lysophospholipase L1-like esterase
MRAAVLILGVFASVVAGAATALLFGDIAGYIVAGSLIAAAVGGIFVSRTTQKGLLTVAVVALLAGLAVAAWGGYTVVTALGSTEGPVAEPDAAMLASADAKIDAAAAATAFRLILSEAELRAYSLDALRGEPDNPIADITFDVVPGDGASRGELRFAAELKRGGMTTRGAVTAALEGGRIDVDVIDVGLGAFQVPGLAKGAIEDLVARVADFDTILSERRADVQAIDFTDDTIVIVGTQASTDLLTSASFLAGFGEQAASAVDVVTPPAERIGPGVVDSTAEGGAPFYVALGDSLAANVGVEAARDGYVSRFHKALQERDGATYGLRNFGVSGETTGTMIRDGQLEAATAFMEANDVAYVTIDIGANNLLGHLGSGDCSRSLDDAACRERIDDVFAAYPGDLEIILDAVAEAAPDATIVFLTTYNPFNLGFGTALEAAMDRTTEEFNAIAAGVASNHGILVADGFTPMRATAPLTTHMVDAEPDIHPLPIGYDILAVALLDALD